GLLVLPRTVKRDATGAVAGYGNLYGNLLDYVISAALIFYILTILGSSCCDENGPMQNAPTRLSVIRSCPCSISLAPASFSPCSSSIKLQLPGRALSSC